LLIAFCYKIC